MPGIDPPKRLARGDLGLKPVVGIRPNSDHPGLPGVGAGPVGESGLGALIHTLGFGWGDAWPAVTGEH